MRLVIPLVIALFVLAPLARAGLIGKAFLYGLGAMGEEGVARTIEIIRKELSVSMALTGQTDVRRVGRDVIWRDHAVAARPMFLPLPVGCGPQGAL